MRKLFYHQCSTEQYYKLVVANHDTPRSPIDLHVEKYYPFELVHNDEMDLTDITPLIELGQWALENLTGSWTLIYCLYEQGNLPLCGIFDTEDDMVLFSLKCG